MTLDNRYEGISVTVIYFNSAIIKE